MTRDYWRDYSAFFRLTKEDLATHLHGWSLSPALLDQPALLRGMIRVVAVAGLVVAGSACHSSSAVQSTSTSVRSPPPCSGDMSSSLTIAQALSTRKGGDLVLVEGYLVRAPGACTMMNCTDSYPNCNSCEITLRLASSPNKAPHALSLYSARTSYACWSNAARQCVFDANGQHVLARGTLHLAENSLEFASLVEPQICTLSR